MLKEKKLTTLQRLALMDAEGEAQDALLDLQIVLWSLRRGSAAQEISDLRKRLAQLREEVAH